MSNEIKNKERKVFLENLPRWQSGRYKGCVNWKETIGCIVECLYDEEKYYIKIIGYEIEKKNHLTIEWNDITYTINTGNFCNCQLGKLFGKITDEFKINIGDEIGDLIIIDRFYKNSKNKNRKIYQYRCKVCGWDKGEASESNLFAGNGCACCSGRVVVEGINDLATLRPDLVKYFKNPNEAKQVTVSSHKKIEFVCYECGNEKSVRVASLTSCGLSCSMCSDGVKIPEKFMISILNQANASFETQYTPKWGNNRRYDFKLHERNILIETHGIHHYEKTNMGRGLKNEQANDLYKKKLALLNGIDDYIIIDCRYSELEWIKNSILNSKLAELYDLSNIDFEEAFRFAISNNYSTMVRDMWNNREGKGNSVSISKKLGISRDSVVRYLNFWSSIGICDYTGNNKPIEIYKNEKSLGTFISCSELSKLSEAIFGTNLNISKISMVANGKKPQYKGYTFRYITKEEYEQRKSQSA